MVGFTFVKFYISWTVSNLYKTRMHEYAFSEAARGGHLQILQWALDKGIALNGVCSQAALGGHLEILRWALEKGFTFDKTWEDQKKFSRAKVLQWLEENGF
jgi:hypothetical protein